MPIQDAQKLKEGMISFLKMRGPMLPVHIAKDAGLTILFASAFLSELISDKKIKMSNMRIGSSPLYFLEGQENLLENFSEHLKSREKDAFLLLKEKKFLKHSEQEPAIRVALNEIKDFAVPFRIGDEMFWRYFLAKQSEFKGEKPKEAEKIIPAEEIAEKIKIEPAAKTGELKEKKIPEKARREKSKKKNKRKTDKKRDENFFNKIKEFLALKSVELLGIENFSRGELVLRIREDGAEKMLVAYNKKRLAEKDIVEAHKKASGKGLKYKILSFGELTKKTESLINALKDLDRLEKIEPENKNL